VCDTCATARVPLQQDTEPDPEPSEPPCKKYLPATEDLEQFAKGFESVSGRSKKNKGHVGGLTTESRSVLAKGVVPGRR